MTNPQKLPSSKKNVAEKGDGVAAIRDMETKEFGSSVYSGLPGMMALDKLFNISEFHNSHL